MPMIKKYRGKIPMLGICLGHQAMIEALGGKVTRAPLPVHGKKSLVSHQGSALFKGIPNPFCAGRYHSLYGSEVPSCFKVTATADGLPMAIENLQENMYGLQFHPESILTPHGSRILRNLMDMLEKLGCLEMMEMIR